MKTHSFTPTVCFVFFIIRSSDFHGIYFYCFDSFRGMHGPDGTNKSPTGVADSKQQQIRPKEKTTGMKGGD